VFRLGIKTAGV